VPIILEGAYARKGIYSAETHTGDDLITTVEDAGVVPEGQLATDKPADRSRLS
jgi:hypothetical protein